MKIQEEIIKLIEKMEANTFLMPNAFSEDIQMSDKDFSYKTYVGSRTDERYITIYITENGKKIEIQITRNKVSIPNLSIDEKINKNKIYQYVKDIYDEMHSFKNHSEGKRKIRSEIKNAKLKIAKLKKSIKEYEKQLLDCDILENKGGGENV